MVEASELAFRLMTRRFGTDLAYTPMLHSRMSLESDIYLAEHFTTCPQDRPLIAQLCGNDPETVLAAAQAVLKIKPKCYCMPGECTCASYPAHRYPVDAIDLNLGCPQNIAKRGHYGAFLLEETATIVRIVQTLHEKLDVPVTAKIRILSTWEDTIRTVLSLQAAGASAITVHGRTRYNMKQTISAVDWDIIQRIKSHPDVTVPIIVNGGIAHVTDVDVCLKHTGADAVMSSEALLENPALFSRQVERGTGKRFNCLTMAQEYLKIAAATRTPIGIVKGHIMKYLFASLTKVIPIRDELCSNSVNQYDLMLDACKRLETHINALPALYNDKDEMDESHPRFSEFRECEKIWLERRKEHPASGISFPTFVIDPREPGLWYMRHRQTWFDAEPTPVEEGKEAGDALAGRLAEYKRKKKVRASEEVAVEEASAGMVAMFQGEEDW
jgi:tRNA-dihydrouridine synthase 1